MTPDEAFRHRPATAVPATTAVIPAAGLGTRMRPATHAVPKELLPVGGRPALDWVLEEAVLAGIGHIVVVLSRDKPAVERYLALWEAMPRSSGSTEWTPSVEVVYQPQPSGLGDAVRLGRDARPGEALAVLLPDEIMIGGPRLLASMIERYRRSGASVVSVLPVAEDAISAYGCVELAVSVGGDALRVSGCVEKPQPEHAPSNLALCGRYVLSPAALAHLDNVSPDHRGEIQLTPALDRAAATGSVLAIEIDREVGRIDVGNWQGWLNANLITFGAEALASSGRPLASALAGHASGR